MEARDLLEEDLRKALESYRRGAMDLNTLSNQASRLVAGILRLRTEQLLGAMKFVHALEEINDALTDEGRRATAAERTQIDRQLSRLETLLLGLSAMSHET